MATTSAHPNISRHEGQTSNGWQVRVRRHGEVHNRFFSDRVHGDADAALQAALAFRDALLIAFPAETTRDRRDRLTRRNTTGHVGVRLEYTSRRGHTYARWVARWTDDEGGLRSISFGVLRYGDAGARRRAEIARTMCSRDREVIEATYAREARQRRRQELKAEREAAAQAAPQADPAQA